MSIIIDGTGSISGVSSTGLTTAQTVTQSAIATGVAGTGPAFAAYAGSTTSLSNTVWTKVTLDTETFDTNNNFASSRFTPTVAGYYQINGQAQINSATIPCAVDIYKNGASTGYVIGGFQSGQVFATTAVSRVIYMNGTTDYIELYVYQASGITLTTQNNIQTQMSGSMVRAG
jgi:hypothetical protein